MHMEGAVDIAMTWRVAFFLRRMGREVGMELICMVAIRWDKGRPVQSRAIMGRRAGSSSTACTSSNHQHPIICIMSTEVSATVRSMRVVLWSQATWASLLLILQRPLQHLLEDPGRSLLRQQRRQQGSRWLSPGQPPTRPPRTRGPQNLGMERLRMQLPLHRLCHH